MLNVVGSLAGHACALAIARHLVLYLRREGADPQLSPWLAGRNHLHPAVHRVQDAISRKPRRKLDVDASRQGCQYQLAALIAPIQ